ncbi:hypothetical protein ACFX15_002995 [Malus domestica]
MESIHVKIDDINVPPSLANKNDDVLFPSSNDNSDASGDTVQVSRVIFKDKPKWASDHHDEEIVGPIDKGIITRRQIANEVANVCHVSQIEPKNMKDALTNEKWILAMQDELNQFEKTENKSYKSGNVIRNKARLVAQRYSKLEGVDFDKTFAHVAHLELVRLLYAIACYLKFKLFQMDVKTSFLNGYLNEEVYIEQLKGFEDPHKLDEVYN